MKLMQGQATMTLFAETQNVELFKNVLHPQTIIDAKLNFFTCEGETISIDVFDFLKLDWKVVEDEEE